MYNLIHGDCLEEMDKLIADGVKVDLILTDPPYGTTACKWDSIIPFEPMWNRLNVLGGAVRQSFYLAQSHLVVCYDVAT